MSNKKQERRKRENDRRELFQLLANHSQLRTGQDQVLWSIFGIFWATQGLLLISIFTAVNYKAEVGWIISGIGMIVSLVWVLIQGRALKRLERYEEAIKEIEKQLNLKSEKLNTFYSINPDCCLTARNIMRFSVVLSFLLWMVALIIFLYPIFSFSTK